MKKNPSILISICLLFAASNSGFSQKTIENVVIVAFESPYEVLTVLVDEEQYDYQVTQETAFTDRKNKADFCAGSEESRRLPCGIRVI